MYIVRPAQAKDIDDLYALALKSSLGLTNFPKDKELLAKMLHDTEIAFQKEIREPHDELYVFCMERLTDHKVIGSSMIYARIPYKTPLPYFLRYPQEKWDMLHAVFDDEGASELCGLYVDPDIRGEGLGKLISVSRFFFIADHLKRFMNKLFADIHGYVDPEGNCTFWDGVMRPFFNMTFKEAVLFYIKDLEGFNAKIPTLPIYCDLIPESIKQTIGQIHPKSIPAQKLLEHQNVILTDRIHPLDGGPRVEGFVGKIRGIQESDIVRAARFEKNEGRYHLIGTSGRTFRSTIGRLTIADREAVIDPEAARDLFLEKGELCRILPLF